MPCQERPNLLFIFTDQQRADTMACYGNDYVRTPNLNALADRSFVFENAYVTQPVCTPSRSSIMTGLWPHTNGCVANNIPLRPETPTMAEMLPDGYAHGYVGKWHLGDEVIAQHGFDTWVSIDDNYREYYSRPEYLEKHCDYYHYLQKLGYEPNSEKKGAPFYSRGMAAMLPPEHTKAAFTGREAAGFIEEHHDEPFCLYVNFFEPHTPYLSPLAGLYDPGDIPAGPHFRRLPPENASRRHRLKADFYSHRASYGYDWTQEAAWREVRQQYLGNVTLIDRGVGAVLETLEKRGLAENTVVVFTSDHGDLLGDHGISAKTVMYEGAVKVPLLIRVPWLNERQCMLPGRVSQVDLVPTLLDLLGEPVPAELQGTGRTAVLSGAETLAGNDVFIEWTEPEKAKPIESTLFSPEETVEIVKQPWRTVVSREGWKLNLSPGDQCELYDLNNDPYEMENRFDRPEHKPLIRELTERIRQWQEQVDDDMPVPEL